MGERRDNVARMTYQGLDDVLTTVVASKPRQWLPISWVWIVNEKYPVDIFANKRVDVLKAPVVLFPPCNYVICDTPAAHHEEHSINAIRR